MRLLVENLRRIKKELQAINYNAVHQWMQCICNGQSKNVARREFLGAQQKFGSKMASQWSPKKKKKDLHGKKSWFRSRILVKTKKNLHRKKIWFCPQVSVKAKKEVLADLKHGFTSNWLTQDILFQIIWGGGNFLGGKSNVFRHEMQKILLKMTFKWNFFWGKVKFWGAAAPLLSPGYVFGTKYITSNA